MNFAEIINKRVAIAVIAAISAPACADTPNVNVYGNFDVSYDNINTGTSTAGATGVTTNRVSSNTSFIGFKGSVDASDGLSAIWQVESLIVIGDAAANGTTNNVNNGMGYLGNRNTFVGLKDETYGTVLAGRNDTPYRLSTRRFDVFDRGIADNRAIIGGSNVAAKVAFDGRQDQVVEYLSPTLDGFAFAAAHANLSPTVNVASSYQGDLTSAAFWYEANGLYGTFASERHSLQNPATLGYLGSESAIKVGFGYKREGVFAVGFLAEQSSDNLGTGGTDLYGHNAYYLSGRLKAGHAGEIKTALTSAGNIGGGANTGGKQYSLGYDYHLNQRITLYALYTKLVNDPAAAYSLSIFNGTAASIGGPSTIAGTGAAPSALATGVLVTF